MAAAAPHGDAGPSPAASPTAAADAAAAAGDMPVPGTPTHEQEHDTGTAKQNGASAAAPEEGAAAPEEFDPEAWQDPAIGHSRMLEKIVDKLADSVIANGAAAPKHNNYKAISNIRIPDFFGGTAVSVKEYRDFKKYVQVNQELYQATSEQMAFCVWLPCKGDARRALEFLDPMVSLRGPGALDKIWAVLYAQCEQLTHERRTELYTRWERLVRHPGEPMHMYISSWYRTLAELKAMDPQTSLSLVAQADKMLRGAALATKDQRIALMWSGGGADPQKLEKVLRQYFDK